MEAENISWRSCSSAATCCRCKLDNNWRPNRVKCRKLREPKVAEAANSSDLFGTLDI